MQDPAGPGVRVLRSRAVVRREPARTFSWPTAASRHIIDERLLGGPLRTQPSLGPATSACQTLCVPDESVTLALEIPAAERSGAHVRTCPRRSASAPMPSFHFPYTIRRNRKVRSSAALHENSCAPWNKGKLIGQKPPLKLAEIWTVRTQLRMAGIIRDPTQDLSRHVHQPARTANALPVVQAHALRTQQ